MSKGTTMPPDEWEMTKGTSERKFETSFGAAQRLITKLAQGEGDKKEAVMAIEKLWDRLNKPELRGNEPLNDRVCALHRERIAACDSFDKVARESREKQISWLRAQAREEAPVPGTYKHELALMRGGR